MFSVRHVRYMTSVCLIAGDIHSDHLVKVLSAVFFYCKVTTPYMINIWREILRGYENILFLPELLSTDISSSVDLAYYNYYFPVGLKVILHFPH